MNSNIPCISIHSNEFCSQQVLDHIHTHGLAIIEDCYFDSQAKFLDFVSTIARPIEFAYSKSKREPVSTINHVDKNHVLFPQAGARWNDRMTGDWHLDVVFADPVINYTILYGNVITPNVGHTMFADSAEAYRDLSPAYRQMINDLKIVHYRQPNKRYSQRDWELEYLGGNIENITPKDLVKLKEWLESAYQNTTRPLITKDPAGTPCIYLSPSKAVKFEGFTEDESRNIILFLQKHVTRPEYTYTHTWKQGQLAIWANCRLWHYGVYNYQGWPRELWRCHLE
jgi:taurine dioxygenase